MTNNNHTKRKTIKKEDFFIDKKYCKCCEDNYAPRS